MATTEMDSRSSESKSEKDSLDPDSKYPLKVLYCGGTLRYLLSLCTYIHYIMTHFQI